MSLESKVDGNTKHMLLINKITGDNRNRIENLERELKKSGDNTNIIYYQNLFNLLGLFILFILVNS